MVTSPLRQLPSQQCWVAAGALRQSAKHQPPPLAATQPSPSLYAPWGGSRLCPFNGFPKEEDGYVACVSGGGRGGGGVAEMRQRKGGD